MIAGVITRALGVLLYASCIALAQASTKPGSDMRVVYGKHILLWSLVLLFVFLIAAAAIIRFSRRYRAYLVRHEKRPTPSTDVWSMHQPPKNDVEGRAEEPDDGEN